MLPSLVLDGVEVGVEVDTEALADLVELEVAVMLTGTKALPSRGYKEQFWFGAAGQLSAMQTDCNSAGAEMLAIATAGAHRVLNDVFRMCPSTLASSVEMPREVAESSTC